MVKKRELTQTERDHIIALHVHANKSTRQIAKDTGISQSTVSYTINKFNRTGEATPGTRTGRPRVTTKRDDRTIAHYACKDPFISATEIKRNLPLSVANISVDTIKRRLRQHFKAPIRRTARKPLLTTTMLKKRLAFCKKYKNWSQADWRKVLFSDEATFLQFPAGPRFVRRPLKSSAVNPRYTARTVKHPPSIMVWGCFSYHGRGAITILPRGVKMNTNVYLNILEEKLENFMDIYSCSTFQQDSAPCHVSKKSKDWFRQHSICLLDWPGNSPDLNPIENLWMVVKQKLAGVHFNSLSALEEEIKRVWCTEITVPVCQRLVDSMPKRIQNVLRHKGFPIKY